MSSELLESEVDLDSESYESLRRSRSKQPRLQNDDSFPIDDEEIENNRENSNLNNDYDSPTETSPQEETITPAELFLKIYNHWKIEKLVPELMPPLSEEVDAMLEELLRIETETKLSTVTTVRSFYIIEVLRVRYVIRDYLKIRLLKLQKYHWYYMDIEERKPSESYLTPREKIFLQSFNEMTVDHLKNEVLEKLPVIFRSLNTKEFIIKPGQHDFVLVLVNQTGKYVVKEGGFGDDEGTSQEANFERGTIYCVRFDEIREPILKGEVTPV